MKSTKKQQGKKQPLLVRIASHNLFFWSTVFLFALNALWIAFSAVYPMLFDEEFHVGIIEVYSHQLSPFITSQAAETVFHGDLTRSASYLFHWLMSFPYRFIALFTSDLAIQVIFLRVINICFVIISLWLFRKTLLLGGFSRALSNLSVFFFTLIPLVPFTAAHINYDNLIMIFTAGIFYAALKSVKKSSQQAAWVIAVITIGFLGSLTKFTFLPVFAATLLFMAINVWKQYGKHAPAKLFKQYKNLSKPAAIFLTIIAIISTGLFMERYGGNVIQYRSLEPKCDRIHSKELCSQYNIWDRNTRWAERYEKEQWPLWNPAEYTVYRWIPHIFNDLFITGAYTGGEVALRKPLGHLEATPGAPIIRIAGWSIFMSAAILTIVFWRKLKLKKIRFLFLASIGLYAAALWVKNYSDYTTYGFPVATQGRYFIPFLIPLIAMAGYTFSVAIKKRYIKEVLLVVALLLFTQGAGATTYILYSNKNWYWPNQTVQGVNQSAQKALNVFIYRP